MKHSTSKPTQAEAERMGIFPWHKVDIRSNNECWQWNGSLNIWGYGVCQYNGKTSNASRVAYIDAYGQIDPGLVVCHKCDNPRCCNPAHLWADTQANNLADCRSKGRQVYRTGESHHRTGAKLNPEKVREAKRLYASGVSQSEIGRRWGVCSSVISRAVRGENWSHVK